MKHKIILKGVEKSSSSRNADEPSHYIAVGASAGGLEAIDSLFSKLQPDTGFAFIVIQHLSPDYKSLMVELLSRRTQMPVHRAEDNMEIKANNVYLIPPKKNLTIFHNKLFLIEQDHSKGINLPIDVFLKSLAEDQGEKAIAIILSGTGSDGTRGLRFIKEYGGMVMVQKEETAKFDGMPRAAISTGLCDFILAPDEMPEKLLSYSQHPYISKYERADSLLTDEEGLSRIFSLLRDKCKADFTFYKPSTISRRIERRMTINQIDNIKSYVEFLQNYQNEIGSLYKELLIGVTSFFRDQEAFDSLYNNYLPEVFNNANSREVRFWVAGCSTGEEAYSLAMLAKEYTEEIGKNYDIKIFATDIDKDAIHFAATGIYPESITADVSPKLLSKYFFKKDDNFQIARAVREMVVFAHHNLIKDPPFTNISLLSCRNLLIYLQPILQKKVFEFFNFSLVPNGILMLGTSESTGEMADYFEQMDTKWKIFRSIGRNKSISDANNLLTPNETRGREIRSHSSTFRKSLKTSEEERVLERFLQTLSGEFLPLSIIVNEQFEVIHILGDPAEFLNVPSGKIINNITKMAVKELAVPIATGVQKVFRQSQEVRFSNIRINKSGKEKLIEVRIKPIQHSKFQEQLAVILVLETKKSEISTNSEAFQSFDLSKEAEEHLRELELDLQFTRENLQATIEELETSNEELQATNEELLASNEELQSTNEELQSTNEELHTVNVEYQNKIIELTELQNDIDNILNTAEISHLLLDENLEVRRFSPNIVKIFNLLMNDIGRPITHISHYIKEIDPIELIRSVQLSSKSFEREVCIHNEKNYLMRIVPYLIGPKMFSGIIITFVDITELSKSRQEIRLIEMKYKELFDTMELGVVFQNAEGEIISANSSAERILGLTYDQLIGRKSIDPRWRAIRLDGSDYPGEEHPAMLALKTGKRVVDKKMGIFNPLTNNITWINISAVPQFRDNEDKPYQVYATFSDITAEINFRDLFRESENQYKSLFEEMPSAVAVHQMIFDENDKPFDYIFLKVNARFEEITGLKADDIINKNVKSILPNIEQNWLNRYGEIVKTGKHNAFVDYNNDLQKYFEIKAFKTGETNFAVIFNEITTDTRKIV